MDVSLFPVRGAVVAIALCAAVTIVAEERKRRRLTYVFKPLTTLLILLLALGGEDPRYRTLIAAGLAFSLAGDVLLMLPRDRFAAGLAAFLVAHLFYIAAFTDGGWRTTAWIAAPFVAYAAVLLRLLLPRAGGLRLPVLAYAAVLAAMAWRAAERGAAGVPGGALAAAGAALFVVSDSALAISRFVGDFRLSPTLVLGGYYAAQTLIALSALA